MKREELLRSSEYWLAHIQSDLYAMIEDYRKKNNLKNKDLASIFNVSKGYISQILNGDFDHKISKMIALSLACGKAPIIDYQDLEQYIKNDEKSETTCLVPKERRIQYILSIDKDSVEVSSRVFKVIQNAQTNQYSQKNIKGWAFTDKSSESTETSICESV